MTPDAVEAPVFAPAPGAAPLRQMIAAQAALETRTLLRNGEQLLLTLVIPLLLAAVTAWCAERGVLANSLRIESRTLEDVFLELTGKELRS